MYIWKKTFGDNGIALDPFLVRIHLNEVSKFYTINISSWNNYIFPISITPTNNQDCPRHCCGCYLINIMA